MKFSIAASLILVFCCGICRSGKAKEKAPSVKTTLGTIEGFYNTSSGGKLYEAYVGIPYAKQITKERRFKIAEPITPWTGVLSAKSFGPSCLQIEVLSLVSSSPMVSGSEDCLYLNIYTPARRFRNKAEASNGLLLPVILFIHGGGFQFGSGAQYGPDYLLNEPVLFVTINYRLGPLGFLSTEDETIPGNMGLKDQVMAMRFIKDNIFYFGGDPESITLVGQSAGGASVHYHHLTKVTEGLFQRGLSISGTALDPWTQSERNLEKAKKLANVVRCPSCNIRDMVECLRTRSAEEITRATLEFRVWLNTPVTPFGPVVETGTSNLTFISQSPIDSIISGNVQDIPWITTIVSEEGLAPSALFVANASLVEELNNDWERLAPFLLDYDNTIPESAKSKVSKLIRKYYIGTKPIDDSTVNQIIRMVGDRFFDSDAGKAAKLQSLAIESPVRFCYFSYRGAHSATEFFTGTSTNYGVMHFDDLSYVLKSFFDPTTTQRDREMQKLMIKFWVSYATNGVPDMGIDWPRLLPNMDELRFLHIAGPDNVHMNKSLNFGNKDFWQSIPFNENIPTR